MRGALSAGGPRRIGWSALVLLLLLSGRSSAEPVSIVVLKEHGIGNQTVAQPYLDRFVALAAQRNGWGEARGRYFTARGAAEAFIAGEKPHYAILSLDAFLAMRKPHKLDVVGQVAVTLVGGRQYHVVSKSARDLADCRNRKLASDHIGDARYIERVVAAGVFTLSEFTLVETRRPLQTIKQVLNGQAECALIDDAQLNEIAHLEGGSELRSLWKSAELPPMVVTAFPAASAEERKRFQENLSSLCAGENQNVCAEVGITSLASADGKLYASVVAAYGD